jgi:hypothetical protein
MEEGRKFIWKKGEWEKEEIDLHLSSINHHPKLYSLQGAG